MLNIVSINDLGNDWIGFAKVWDVDFNGVPLTISKQNVCGGDEDNIYFYWSYYVRHDNLGYLMSCNQYDTGYIEWNEFSIPEGFDWETFRKEVKEVLEVELPTK